MQPSDADFSLKKMSQIPSFFLSFEELAQWPSQMRGHHFYFFESLLNVHMVSYIFMLSISHKQFTFMAVVYNVFFTTLNMVSYTGEHTFMD
jgi:hypothetical protein